MRDRDPVSEALDAAVALLRPNAAPTATIGDDDGGWSAAWHRHLATVAAARTDTGRALLEVVKLHVPTGYGYTPRCAGDDSCLDIDLPLWPCRTISQITDALGTPMHAPCRHCPSAYESRLWPDGTFVEHLIYPPADSWRSPYRCPGSDTPHRASGRGLMSEGVAHE
jgi:hypothetical protein